MPITFHARVDLRARLSIEELGQFLLCAHRVSWPPTRRARLSLGERT